LEAGVFIDVLSKIMKIMEIPKSAHATLSRPNPSLQISQRAKSTKFPHCGVGLPGHSGTAGFFPAMIRWSYRFSSNAGDPA
jgi:hypothetical protein